MDVLGVVGVVRDVLGVVEFLGVANVLGVTRGSYPSWRVSPG